MDPYLRYNRVTVRDPSLASTLVNKGSFGSPRQGGGLDLDLLEATYLAENDRITVLDRRGGDPLSWWDLLLRGDRSDPGFTSRYVVYRDLRDRGLVARIGGEGGFLLYPRGTKGLKAKATGWVHVFSGDDTVTIGQLDRSVRSNDGMRMSTLCGIADSDWDVTFYSARIPGIAEASPVSDQDLSVNGGGIELHHLEGPGSLAMGENMLVLGSERMIGTRMGEVLLLSQDEYVLVSGKEEVKDRIDPRTRAYLDLRKKGYRVRSGLKYGCHFRVYTGRDPAEHSSHLVHCMDPERSLSWEELARSIRLCHSVRKRMVYAHCRKGEGPISYLELEWTRP